MLLQNIELLWMFRKSTQSTVEHSRSQGHSPRLSCEPWAAKSCHRLSRLRDSLPAKTVELMLSRRRNKVRGFELEFTYSKQE